MRAKEILSAQKKRIRIRAEIGETENRKSIEKTNKPKAGSLERSIKSVSLELRKDEGTQMTSIRNESRQIPQH